VLERSRLFLRENDHLPGSLCESLEHLYWSFLLLRNLGVAVQIMLRGDGEVSGLLVSSAGGAERLSLDP
jgi:hypothetical protein